MLKAIDTDLWVAEQPLKYFGLEVGTRMTIVRLNQHKLMVISPICLNEAIIDQLDQLGQVSYIVSPNLYHHLFLNQFKQAYPSAEIWVTSGLEHKRPDLQIDQVLSDRAVQSLGDIEALQVEGFSTLSPTGYELVNEWAFFHPKTRTLIVTDLAFHFDSSSSLITQLISRLLGGYQQLRPSFLEKMATRDKAQVKQSIQQILAWDFDRVIVAHGSILEQGGKQQFQQGYEWFLEASLVARP